MINYIDITLTIPYPTIDFVLCYLILGSLYVKCWLVWRILSGDVCGGTTHPMNVLMGYTTMTAIWPYMLIGEIYDNYKGVTEND